MHNRISAKACLFLLCLLGSCGRNPEPTIVARIGSRAVSLEEFRSRFALTPYFGQFPADSPETKKMYTASVIAEKLLAEEARANGLDRRPRFVAIAREFEKEALLEVLLRDVFSKLEVTPSETRAALREAVRQLEVKEWVFESRTAADSARGRLLSTAESGGARESASEYTVAWGQVAPEVEDILWSLKPGETSGPVEFNGYYYIFHLASERRQAVPAGAATAALRERVERQLMTRKKRQAYNRFFKSLMAGKSTRVPAEKLRFLAGQLEEAFAIPATSDTSGPGLRPRRMSEGEYGQARSGLSRRLNETLVEFDDGSRWTVGDFLRNLRFGPYPLNYSSKGIFRASLRNQAVIMMEQEYLAKEARRRGLQNSDYVKAEKQMWLDSYLADQARLEVVRSAREASIPDKDRSAGEPFRILDRHLTDRLAATRVEVMHNVLDTLKLKHTRMAVFKKHFPGRAAAPAVLPFDRLPRFLGAVLKK